LHRHLLGQHGLVLLEHLLVHGHLLIDQLLLVQEHLVLGHWGIGLAVTTRGVHHWHGTKERHLWCDNLGGLSILCSKFSLSLGGLSSSLCLGFLGGLCSFGSSLLLSPLRFFLLLLSGSSSLTLELLCLLLGSSGLSLSCLGLFLLLP
jgi:hypothetical protein